MISDLFHTIQDRHLAMRLSRSLRGYDAERDDLIVQATLEALKERSGSTPQQEK